MNLNPLSLFRKHIDPPTAKPITGEVAYSSKSFFGSQNFETYNPDQLIGTQGAGIYKEMLRDDQVKAAFELRQSAILTRPWRFVFDPEDEKQSEMAEFFEETLKTYLRGPFIGLLQQVLQSEAYGYSMTEMIFDTATWNSRPVWVLRRAKAKPYDTFRFKLDPYGNLVELSQDQAGKQVKLDPRKFIYHVTNPSQDPIFGESHLRAAYRHYWRKFNILNFWNIYLERLAGGILVAKATETLTPPQQDSLREVLRNISARSGIQLPPSVDMEVIFAKGGTQDFEASVNNADVGIARAILTPNLLGLTPQQKVGSNAQAEINKDTFDQMIELPAESLAETMNEQLFRKLAFWNFGTEEFPKFEFEPRSEEEKAVIVERWIEAADKGVVKNTFEDELRTRELLGYDAREEGTEEEEQDDGTEEGQNTGVESSKQEEDTVEAGSGHSFTEPSWLNRADFSRMGNTLNVAEDSLTEKLSIQLRAYYQGILEEISEFNPDDPLDIIENLTGPAGQRKDINRVIKAGMSDLYNSEQKEASGELRKATITQNPRLFTKLEDKAAARIEWLLFATTKSPNRAITWEDQPPSISQFIDGLDIISAEQYFQSRAFFLTGQITDSLLADVKQVLLDGIKSGASIPDLMKQLEPLVAPILGELDAAGRRVNPGHRLETIVRTNLADAFNQARMSAFTDPELDGFVEALEYQAILDSRTSPFCRAMDGKVYPINDPIWRNATPPNHFNCRSLLVAVTEADDWESSPALPANQQPASGFGGVE